MMGCFHAKNQSSDLHPNVYRVVNIDENGAELCTGQLEITDSDIILYREGRDSTVWPLHSLRRYGFENEIFSFESGRRCETGEGIYAFRCRRASLLFRTLQQHIQLLNMTQESVSYPVSRMSPPPHGRQTLQASVVHRSSIDNGLPDRVEHTNNTITSNIPPIIVPANVNASPRSPSSADILEVMPLYPRNQNTNTHASNVYQVREFKREHNNNRAETVAETSHVYCNDLNRDLAVLRNTLREEAALNTIRDIEDENRFLESRYMNDAIPKKAVNSLSPTISTSSEHYAQLSIEQQEAPRLYVNITNADINKNDTLPNTPLTPKQIDYCNLTVNKIEPNSYANLILGDATENLRNKNFILHEHNHKFSESDTITSMSPVEEIEVNYAILDMDTKPSSNGDLISPENQSLLSKNESSASCSTMSRSGRLVSQSSTEKGLPTPGGYTTIDFEKTVALTSVATLASDEDCQRKTRHNSGNLHLGSPATNDRIKTGI